VNTELWYKQETLIGKDCRAVLERHHTDHGNPIKHSNPHDHKITWDSKNDPQFSESINYKDNEEIPKLHEVKI